MESSSPAVKINCTDSVDQLSSSTIGECLKQFGNRRPLCRGLSAEAAYNQSWTPWVSEDFNEPRFESYYVDVPKEYVSQGIGANELWKSWERLLIIKDGNTGKIFSLQRIQMELSGGEKKTLGKPQVYFNPSAPFPGRSKSDPGHQYRQIQLSETGLNQSSMNEAQKTWEELLREVSDLGQLRHCDFMKETPQSSAGVSFTNEEKITRLKSCLNEQRSLDHGEMNGICFNLGLNTNFSSNLNLSGEVNSSVYLNILTGAALDNFIKGYAALTGQSPTSDELIKMNPACSDFKSIVDEFNKDKVSQDLIKKDHDKKMALKSDYLKDLRYEAEVRKDINFKDTLPSSLTMAELLLVDKKCKSAKAKLAILDGSSESSIERAKSYEDKILARRDFEDFNCNIIQNKIPNEIRKKEAKFPQLSNHYDAESSDTLWAKPYDIQTGRDLLNKLSSINPKNLKEIKKVTDEQTYKLSKKMKELIADTCSASELECSDPTKMCWHTLMGMKSLTDKIAASANPSFDSIHRCLQKEQRKQEIESNLSAIGAGLACSGVGMMAGIAAGGVTLPATLSAASLACGIGATLIIDGKAQSAALTNLELTRGCFEISQYCSEDQVKDSIESAWWSIFGTKLGLAGEALGVGAELKGLLNLINDLKGPSKEMALLAITKTTQQIKEADQSIRIAKDILKDFNSPNESKIIELSLIEETLSKINPYQFKGLISTDSKISYLKSVHPGKSNDYYSKIVTHLANSKDLEGTVKISQLLKRNGEAIEREIKNLINDPNLSQSEFLERLSFLYSATQRSDLSGASLSATKAFDDLLSEPAIREKINVAANACVI